MVLWHSMNVGSVVIIPWSNGDTQILPYIKELFAFTDSRDWKSSDTSTCAWVRALMPKSHHFGTFTTFNSLLWSADQLHHIVGDTNGNYDILKKETGTIQTRKSHIYGNARMHKYRISNYPCRMVWNNSHFSRVSCRVNVNTGSNQTVLHVLMSIFISFIICMISAWWDTCWIASIDTHCRSWCVHIHLQYLWSFFQTENKSYLRSLIILRDNTHNVGKINFHLFLELNKS